jgi:hypothetical protein
VVEVEVGVGVEVGVANPFDLRAFPWGPSRGIAASSLRAARDVSDVGA